MPPDLGLERLASQLLAGQMTSDGAKPFAREKNLLQLVFGDVHDWTVVQYATSFINFAGPLTVIIEGLATMFVICAISQYVKWYARYRLPIQTKWVRQVTLYVINVNYYVSHTISLSGRSLSCKHPSSDGHTDFFAGTSSSILSASHRRWPCIPDLDYHMSAYCCRHC